MSAYPGITVELVKRRDSYEDIKEILGGNILRMLITSNINGVKVLVLCIPEST